MANGIDLTQLSDEELLALAEQGGVSTQAPGVTPDIQTGAVAASDLSALSDEELLRLAGEQDISREAFLQEAGAGAPVPQAAAAPSALTPEQLAQAQELGLNEQQAIEALGQAQQAVETGISPLSKELLTP